MMQEETNFNEINSPTREQTAGEVLRFYRESLGLELDTVAKHLHVPSSKLKALEDNRLHDLPDTVFARSLALAVCRHLNQDPAPVLQLLPQFDTQRLAVRDERGLNSPIRRPALSTQPFWPGFLHKLSGMRWAALAIVLLAVLTALWPEIQRQWASHESSLVVEPSTPQIRPEAQEQEPELVQGQMVITPVHSTLLQALPSASDASTPGDANVR